MKANMKTVKSVPTQESLFPVSEVHGIFTIGSNLPLGGGLPKAIALACNISCSWSKHIVSGENISLKLHIYLYTYLHGL